MQPSLYDLAFLASASSLFGPTEDFEGYSDAALLNALNGGSGWIGAYVDKAGIVGVQQSESFDTYTDAASLNGLNAGNGWSGAFVDKAGLFGLKASDTIESYSDTASVNGLNGGTGSWNGAWIDTGN